MIHIEAVLDDKSKSSEPKSTQQPLLLSGLWSDEWHAMEWEKSNQGHGVLTMICCSWINHDCNSTDIDSSKYDRIVSVNTYHFDVIWSLAFQLVAG